MVYCHKGFILVYIIVNSADVVSQET